MLLRSKDDISTVLSIPIEKVIKAICSRSLIYLFQNFAQHEVGLLINQKPDENTTSKILHALILIDKN